MDFASLFELQNAEALLEEQISSVEHIFKDCTFLMYAHVVVSFCRTILVVDSIFQKQFLTKQEFYFTKR